METDLQDILHSAYSAIRGAETNKALAPLTLDHLLQELIDSIQGGASRNLLSASGSSTNTSRVSKLDALDTIEKSINDVVAQVENAGNDEAKLQKLGLSNTETTT